jgi:hypothetical protein
MAYRDAGAKLDRVVGEEILKGGLHGVDRPCCSETADAFGFCVLAKDLFSAMTAETLETPFTLCIDGLWGAGKSSLARLIYAQFLKDSSIQLSWFNVKWKRRWAG